MRSPGESPDPSGIPATERRVRHNRLRPNVRTRYELLARATTDIILFIDPATLRIIDANVAAERAYGYSRSELSGLAVRDLCEASAETDVAQFVEMYDRPGGAALETQHVRRDGRPFTVEVVSHATAWRGESIVVSTIRDITGRRRASARDERLARLLRLTLTPFSSERDGIDELLELSAQLIREKVPFGARLRRLEGGAPGADWPDAVGPSARPTELEADLDRLCTEILSRDAALSDDARTLESSGETYSAIGAPVRVGILTYGLLFTGAALYGAERFTEEDRDFVALLAASIAERLNHRRLLGQMRERSENDVLTGLPTRAAFRAQVGAAIAEDGACTLAVVDIDEFRHVNTTFGRQTADALLVEVAARLDALRRPGEHVGRLGADSFGVLLRNDHDFISLRIDALRGAFAEPFSLGDRDGVQHVEVSAGIGVARGANAEDTFERLLIRADTAVADAKARENGGVAFSSPEQAQAIADADVLRTELRRAIANDELEMFVQPLVELATMRVVAAEALVRWNHPTRGLLTPGDFVDFAERNGLMRELSAWVSEQTIALVAGLDPWLVAGIRVSFNVSATDLAAAGFAQRLADQLRKHPGVEHLLGIEVTETAAMRNVDATATALAEVRLLGLHVAIDDFGTGYSSLAYLSRLPVNTMKLDRGFIAQLSDEHGAALVETFISLAAQFGYASIAEGVETQKQLDWLRAHGCTMAQGYFLARPMQFTTFRTYLRTLRRSGLPLGLPAR